MQHQATQAAADNLGIDLNIIYTPKNTFQTPDSLQAIVSKKPDYIIFTYRPHTRHLLSLAEKHRVFTLTQSPPNDINQRAIGLPRERYSYWLGSLASDDTGAAQRLTEKLYREALRSDSHNSESLSLMAFNGAQSTTSAIHRREGLQQAAYDNNIAINHIFEFSWSPDIATKSLNLALNRYPDTKIFWSASDLISLSVIQKMKRLGLQPNTDFYTAGFDWTQAGLDSIERGEMLASAGGQHLNPAWMLVLIYDHYHNNDFLNYGTHYSIEMPIIDQSNIQIMRPYLDKQKWKTIDFKSHTKTHSKNFDGYNFDLFDDLSTNTEQDRNLVKNKNDKNLANKL